MEIDGRNRFAQSAGLLPLGSATFFLILVGGIVLGAILGMVFVLTGRIGLLISTQALGAIISSFNGVLVSVLRATGRQGEHRHR